MEILELINSPKPTKRLRIVLQIGDKQKHFDFGSPTAHTYIDGATIQTRDNFRKRHTAREAERNKIENYIPSPALFAYRLLWGDSPDLLDNLVSLQKKLSQK